MPNVYDEYDKTEREGLIVKSADVSIQEVTPEELKKINKFTLEPLKAEDVFVFKMSMCDNETDDRNYEPFNLRALKDMKTLYIGKTVIAIVDDKIGIFERYGRFGQSIAGTVDKFARNQRQRSKRLLAFNCKKKVFPLSPGSLHLKCRHRRRR